MPMGEANSGSAAMPMGEAKPVGRDATAEVGATGGGGVTVAARLRFSHLRL